MGSPPHPSLNLSGRTDPEPTIESEDCQQRYQRLFENAPVVAYSLDNQLRTLYISPYCLKVFGYSKEEIKKDNLFWVNHIHPEDRQRVRLSRELYLKEGKDLTLEYRIIHRDQTARHIINHTIPITHNNRIQCIDGFIFDITARKHLEDQLILTERIKVLNDMSLGVAHEIRNPLTSIGGFARLLGRRMTSDDPGRAHLEIILKEVSRLEETVNRVLDGFKRIKLHPAPADINAILTKVLNQLNHEFHHRGIEISTRLSHKLPELELDRHLVEEGLRSIIRTTIRGMGDGGRLTITSALNHRYVIIEIDGIHLNPGPFDECQLFFPFYREPAFDGGIGIPVSQQIISQHGGNVVIRNSNDQHASLIITLPIPRSSQQK
ncbi:MAG: PAS domain-containing protein [Deltaproteobacteria bacterium]|nr:MAG: PAS domain-containing protein [Deltaproteobacteria bacterium]